MLLQEENLHRKRPAFCDARESTVQALSARGRGRQRGALKPSTAAGPGAATTHPAAAGKSRGETTPNWVTVWKFKWLCKHSAAAAAGARRALLGEVSLLVPLPAQNPGEGDVRREDAARFRSGFTQQRTRLSRGRDAEHTGSQSSRLRDTAGLPSPTSPGPRSPRRGEAAPRKGGTALLCRPALRTSQRAVPSSRFPGDSVPWGLGWE